MKGIIYCYKSPSGKIYIGQTTDEKTRRATFFNTDYHYGGKYIDSARLKYGPKSFTYEVLVTVETTKDKIKEVLDNLEMLYIKKYNSNDREFGYNLTIGGKTTLGYKFSEESKKKLSELRKGRVFCPNRTPEIQQKISDSLSKKIKVFDTLGNLIGVFKNAKELSNKLNIPVTSIRNCIYRENLYKKTYKISYSK